MEQEFKHMQFNWFQKIYLHRKFKYLTLCCIILLIFLIDTTTDYGIAIAVFYNLVVFFWANDASKKETTLIVYLCIFLTIFSIILTPFGNYKIGLVNMLISIISLLILGSLIVKKQDAQHHADDLEQRLVRLSRIKSLEGATESIVHEVNQPLSAITSSSHSARLWLEKNPPNIERALKAIERIDHDSARINQVVNRTHALIKAKSPLLQVFDFNDAVREILQLSINDIRTQRIQLDDKLYTDKIYAYADKIQIQQVVHNLLSNAIDAVKDMPYQLRNIKISSHQSGDNIYFSMLDTGHGITTEHQKHIFESFWTTKDEGVGIGLSISLMIIEANHGHLSYLSNSTQTIFKFDIPAHNEH